MATVGGILGKLQGSNITQIAEYQLAGTILGALLAPEATALSQIVFDQNASVVLSPAELASAVVRGELTEADAASEARKSGVNAERFHTLTRITGQAPGPADLAVGLRRGLIDPATYDRGIRQGNLRDEWADFVKAMAVQQPSPTAILAAYLEGQVDEGTARSLWAKLGGDPQYFDILYNTQGTAPSPVELGVLANRGIIPWEGEGAGVVSFLQGILEGPSRNKWEPGWRALAEYLPPPRTVTAMVKEGSLSQAQGADLLAKQGLAPDLVTAYVQSAAAQKTATTRDLAQSTITTLYTDQLIPPDVATSMLEALGYDASEAALILNIEDIRLEQRFLGSAVGRVHTFYVGHKISQADADTALSNLQLPADQRAGLIALWGYERQANVRTLTPAEIANAWHYGILDVESAMAELEALGYSAGDAYVYLSIKNKGPIMPVPAGVTYAPPAAPAAGG